MKLDEAKSTAMGMSTRFAADFAVFRLVGWTADEYGVRRADEVPAGAEIAETFTFGQTAVPVRLKPDTEQQRGLFE